MDELEKELQDSLNPDESGELQTDAEPTGEEGSDEPLSEEQKAEEFEKLKTTNAKLYARAKKAEEALKGRKDSEIKHDSTDDSWKEKIEFIVKHKDFDEEQVETLSSFAKGKGISLEEAFGDKLVKRIIEEDQKEKRIANATPEGKSKSSPFKNIQRQIEEATDRNDHKKLWEELSQGKSRGVESE